jgi:bacterioferritin (cytochrome b1)
MNDKEDTIVLGKAVEDAMNEQIKNELFSAYQYLSMAAFCEAENLPGFAHWMRAQAQEETEHAMKFYDFILDRNGRVVLQGIHGPLVEFGSPLEVFEKALGAREAGHGADQRPLRACCEGERLREPDLPAVVPDGAGRGGEERRGRRRDAQEDGRRQKRGALLARQGARPAPGGGVASRLTTRISTGDLDLEGIHTPADRGRC